MYAPVVDPSVNSACRTVSAAHPFRHANSHLSSSAIPSHTCLSRIQSASSPSQMFSGFRFVVHCRICAQPLCGFFAPQILLARHRLARQKRRVPCGARGVFMSGACTFLAWRVPSAKCVRCVSCTSRRHD